MRAKKTILTNDGGKMTVKEFAIVPISVLCTEAAKKVEVFLFGGIL